jgi:hypothetical protein
MKWQVTGDDVMVAFGFVVIAGVIWAVLRFGAL